MRSCDVEHEPLPPVDPALLSAAATYLHSADSSDSFLNEDKLCGHFCRW